MIKIVDIYFEKKNLFTINLTGLVSKIFVQLLIILALILLFSIRNYQQGRATSVATPGLMYAGIHIQKLNDLPD